MAKRWPLAFLLLLALALPGQLSAASNIYPPSNICDATTAGQCAAVSAAGAVSIAGTITTTPSGTQAVSIAQLPNAAALSDSLANPTTTEIGANMLAWDQVNSVWARARTARDADNASQVLQLVPALDDGTSVVWNQRGNTASVAVGITCAACTSTQTGTDQTNFNGRGVRCTYDATIVTSVGSFTVEIDGKDEVSGKYIALLTGTARSTVGTDTLTVYPGIAASANVAASMVVPRIWRVKATFNSGTNQTFTIGCNTLV